MRLATPEIDARTEEQIRLARHFRLSALSTGAERVLWLTTTTIARKSFEH